MRHSQPSFQQALPFQQTLPFQQAQPLSATTRLLRILVAALALAVCFTVVSEAIAQPPKDQLSQQKRDELRKQFEKQFKDQLKGKGLSGGQEKSFRGQLNKQLEKFGKNLQAAAQQHQAQQARKFRLSNDVTMTAFGPVVAAASRATVRVRTDGKDAALGTVVGAEGWIMTKLSQLKGNRLTCKLSDGRELPAKIVGIHADTDLAMLKIQANGLHPVQWRTGPSPAVGEWVATSSVDGKPTAVGVVSVAPRGVTAPRGLLGVGLEQSDDGPRITNVMPNSGAAKAGIKVGDIIRSLNGRAVKKFEDLIARVAKFKAGRTLKLKIKRGDKELAVLPVLGKRPQSARGRFQNSLGGKLSERRSNFDKVLQHDSVLRPTDCGGPLVDLDGRAVGLNIARAGRVESYALTADVVLALVDNLKSGKLAPPPPISETEKSLAAALAQLRLAETAVGQAKAELDRVVSEAQSALKKVEAARSATEKAVKQAADALQKTKDEAKAAQAAGN